MDHNLAIIDLRAGGAGADTAIKPLMLHTILFCPVVRWVCQELLPCGVGRFFVVCDENWREEAAETLKEIPGVTFYGTAEEALDAAGGDVIVVPGAVVPVWGQENRAVYTADADVLRVRLAEDLTLDDCPAEAGSVRQLWQSPDCAPSFLPVTDAARLQAAMPAARELLMRRLAVNGVTVIDPDNTYVDPRCAVAPGVTLLPGTILRGCTVIGRDCEIGPNAIIDVYAAATEHVDQGLSLTLFFPDTVTTRDINKAQIYAWKKGIKTIYYIRLRQLALEGTEVNATCVSCTL